MPATITARTTITFNGGTYGASIDATGNGLEQASPSVPVAKVGQLTTRTDADTGVLTMAGGHGFITGDKIDVFWTGGSRRAMDATVSVNAVTVDGGSGDNLPTNLTAITAMNPTVVPMTVDGDDVLGITAYSPKDGYIVFSSVDAEDNETELVTYQLDAGEGKGWVNGNGVTNPLAEGAVTQVKFSHGNSVEAQTMVAGVVTGGA